MKSWSEIPISSFFWYASKVVTCRLLYVSPQFLKLVFDPVGSFVSKMASRKAWPNSDRTMSRANWRKVLGMWAPEFSRCSFRAFSALNILRIRYLESTICSTSAHGVFPCPIGIVFSFLSVEFSRHASNKEERATGGVLFNFFSGSH